MKQSKHYYLSKIATAIGSASIGLMLLAPSSASASSDASEALFDASPSPTSPNACLNPRVNRAGDPGASTSRAAECLVPMNMPSTLALNSSHTVIDMPAQRGETVAQYRERWTDAAWSVLQNRQIQYDASRAGFRRFWWTQGTLAGTEIAFRSATSGHLDAGLWGDLAGPNIIAGLGLGTLDYLYYNLVQYLKVRNPRPSPVPASPRPSPPPGQSPPPGESPGIDTYEQTIQWTAFAYTYACVPVIGAMYGALQYYYSQSSRKLQDDYFNQIKKDLDNLDTATLLTPRSYGPRQWLRGVVTDVGNCRGKTAVWVDAIDSKGDFPFGLNKRVRVVAYDVGSVDKVPKISFYTNTANRTFRPRVSVSDGRKVWVLAMTRPPRAPAPLTVTRPVKPPKLEYSVFRLNAPLTPADIVDSDYEYLPVTLSTPSGPKLGGFIDLSPGPGYVFGLDKDGGLWYCKQPCDSGNFANVRDALNSYPTGGQAIAVTVALNPKSGRNDVWIRFKNDTIMHRQEDMRIRSDFAYVNYDNTPRLVRDRLFKRNPLNDYEGSEFSYFDDAPPDVVSSSGGK